MKSGWLNTYYAPKLDIMDTELKIDHDLTDHRNDVKVFRIKCHNEKVVVDSFFTITFKCLCQLNEAKSRFSGNQARMT